MNIQQNIQLENGGTIWLPPSPTYPNTAIPDLSKPDAAQQYDIGCAYTMNGKAFYYAYASGACTGSKLVCKTYKQEVSYQSIGADAAIYATSIVLTVGSSDGIAAGGVVAKDYLKGGQVVVFTADGNTYFTRGIVSNTAVAAGGGTTTVELDAPIPAALTTSDNAEASANPWRDVFDSTAAWMTKLGIPTCYTAGSQYLWVQTWGLSWVAPQSTLGTAGYHQAVSRHDGSVQHPDTVDLNISDQIVGYTVSWGAGGTQAAPFLFLQIAHP